MIKPHVAALTGSLLGALALLLGAGVSVFADARTDRSSWLEQFRRPTEIPVPETNTYTEAKSKLGRTLFFDPILSGSRARSCATCHNPGLSWGDGQPRAIGEKQLPLRSPSLLNVAWTPKLGWDGHFRDLEAVAFGPIQNPANMNLPEKALLERLSAIPGYAAAFDNAFGKGEITRRKIELALATFQRSIVSGEAPFDRWIKGSETAIDASAKLGFDLFVGKAHCVSCHSGWEFTDASFHDIGTASNSDIGRGNLFPISVTLHYAFKMPTMWYVVRRSLYMHNVSIKTLEAVIDLYDRGGIEWPSRSELIAPLKLSKNEKADLIAFLHTLNGAPEQAPVPTLPR